MSASKKFTNKHTDTAPRQNLFCRDAMWPLIIAELGYNPFKETNGCTLRHCQYEAHSCRGAHTLADLKPLSHIVKYNSINKATYDWVRLYNSIKDSIKADSAKITATEFRPRIEAIDTLNFIDLIQLWRELACHYRKIAKELPKKSIGVVDIVQHDHPSGFKFAEDVPNVYLNESLEDTAWGFERLTRRCETFGRYESAIESGNKITIWDLCLATGLNCKEGCHYDSEMICPEDFLTGTCSCKSVAQCETEEIILQQQLIAKSAELLALIEAEKKPGDNDGWVSHGKKGKGKAKTIDPKDVIKAEIKHIKKQIDELSKSRFIHYTEQGMRPFNTLLEEFNAAEIIRVRAELIRQQELEAERQRAEEALCVLAIAEPVKKLGKLGTKRA